MWYYFAPGPDAAGYGAYKSVILYAYINYGASIAVRVLPQRLRQRHLIRQIRRKKQSGDLVRNVA